SSAWRDRRDPGRDRGPCAASAPAQVRHGDDVRRHRDGRGRHPGARMSATGHVIRQRDGAVLRVGFDRPERRNAITVAMYSTLTDALAEAAEDSDIKVVLLHGRPEVFSA